MAVLFIFAAIIDIIEKLPQSFWGGFVAIIAAFGTTILTNRSNYRRLEAQFAHDLHLRKLERELEIRKEIYMAAAEAFAVGVISIGKFANLDVKISHVTDKYAEVSPIIGKIQLIASEEILSEFMKVSNEIGAAFLRLSGKRIPLETQKIQSNQLNDQIVNLEKARDLSFQLMNESYLEGEDVQRRAPLLQGRLDLDNKRISEACERRVELAKTMAPAQLDLVKHSIEEMLRVNRLLVSMIVLVREELGLPIDQSRYAIIVENFQKIQMEGLSEFLKETRGFIESLFKTDGSPPR
jgi:hypothetical protein